MGISEREAVLRERAAFLAGEAWSREVCPRYIFSQREDEREAAKRYPLPRVIRPRIVTDYEGDRWRWTPERGLEFDMNSAPCEPNWVKGVGDDINEKVRPIIAFLLATEEVEDDGQ